MTTYIEPDNLSDLLLVEVKTGWTKQRVTFAKGPAIRTGLVIAHVDGKYVPLDVAATNGAEMAVGVAGDDVDTAEADAKGMAILRGAVLANRKLLWPSDMTSVLYEVAVAQLDSRGISVISTLEI
ncbi:head decoration protein [Glaciimonas immobilis]|uniref:Head decoration protein n=1 Tax=Glaciimonas immobilis TaxID=728004 RepID=A0A840RPC3_9BURK|nr:head decoration protein [Glaciimonas immobilis]KAF3999060.1 head decoration protein [Glaciimonas immobilis]MBB5198490.1 hypothetical protein [Glaciimonas immobilis]